MPRHLEGLIVPRPMESFVQISERLSCKWKKSSGVCQKRRIIFEQRSAQLIHQQIQYHFDNRSRVVLAHLPQFAVENREISALFFVKP